MYLLFSYTVARMFNKLTYLLSSQRQRSRFLCFFQFLRAARQSHIYLFRQHGWRAGKYYHNYYCQREASMALLYAVHVYRSLFIFIYLTLLVYICKTTICSSQKHRNISYTGVARQGRMALTGVNAQNNLKVLGLPANV